MSTAVVRAIVNNRRVEANAPADWPEGTEVAIEPISRDDSMCMREEDWPTTPEGIAALLQSWSEFEPLEMTPEEEAGWNAWRQKIKDYSIANMSKGIEELSE